MIKEIGMNVRLLFFLAEKISPGVKREVIEGAEEQVEQVTEQVRRLLISLRKEPLRTNDAMRCLGLSHRPTFLYDSLRPAIQTGFVEMTQPDSPRSPTQKYRLTERGRSYLQRYVTS